MYTDYLSKTPGPEASFGQNPLIATGYIVHRLYSWPPGLGLSLDSVQIILEHVNSNMHHIIHHKKAKFVFYTTNLDSKVMTLHIFIFSREKCLVPLLPKGDHGNLLVLPSGECGPERVELAPC